MININILWWNGYNINFYDLPPSVWVNHWYLIVMIIP